MLRHGSVILPHIGVWHRDAVMIGIMDEKVRRLAVKHATLGAILLNLHDKPIGSFDRFGLPSRITALDDMAENLRTHRDIDGPVIHTAHLEAHFASGGDGGVFFGGGHTYILSIFVVCQAAIFQVLDNMYHTLLKGG